LGTKTSCCTRRPAWPRAAGCPGEVGVLGVLPGEQAGAGQQADGREDPADGVGGPVGHDHRTHDHERREGQRQGSLLGRVLLEVAVGHHEGQPHADADQEDRQHGPGHPGPAPAHGAASPPWSSWYRAPRGRQRCTAAPSRDRYERPKGTEPEICTARWSSGKRPQRRATRRPATGTAARNRGGRARTSLGGARALGKAHGAAGLVEGGAIGLELL
jgi:hypothetical protein